MTTPADVTAIVNETRNRVETLSEKAETLASEALGAANGAVTITPFTATRPSLRDSPPHFQGNIDLSAELKQIYADALNDMRPELNTGLSSYLATWFPSCVVNNTNSWICNTILTGGTTIPPDIEQAIWERSRSREITEASRMEQEALTQLTARGFSTPPGVTAARLLTVQQDALNKSVTLSRDVAIKTAEVTVDNIRFAVSEGVKIRVAVLQSINEYLKAWFLPETLALEKAKAIASARAVLMNSAADYYRAMVSEAELDLKTQEITATSTNNAASSYANSYVALTELRSKVAEGLAESYGQTAAAAATGIIGVAGSTITAVASA